jgi:hypothetical protein
MALRGKDMSVPISILLFGRNVRLLKTRQTVLESLGYRVYRACDLSTAKHMLLEKQIDLLVLCHSLSMEERGRALALTYRWPMIRSLILTAGDDGCPDNLITEVIDAFDGPAGPGLTVGKFFDVERQTDARVG